MKKFVIVAIMLTGCGDERPVAQRTVEVASESTGVKLRVVKMAELETYLSAQSGKVVVVDLWSDTCAPCKKEFPHLVEFHKKYAKDGLVCVSLNIDEPSEQEAVIRFLKKQNATFENFLLHEPHDVWQKKLDAAMPPAVLVIGKDGKRFKNFGEQEFKYEQVEQAVKVALGKKS